MAALWILVGLVFFAAIGVGLFDAIVAEPGVEAVHITREAGYVALAVTGLVLYVLLTGERLTLGWSFAMIVPGLLVGYGTAWLGGHDARSGVALVPSSRLYPVTYLLSALVAVVGSLGVGVQLLAVGLLGYHLAVAMGVGRLGYRLEAARRAATVFSVDVRSALDRVCESCSAGLQPADRYCRSCGTEQSHTCGACGAAVAPGVAACGLCDAAVVLPAGVAPGATWVRTCLVCTTPLDEDTEFCPTCGVGTTPSCPHCGGAALPGEVDCPVCGIDLQVAAVAAADSAAAQALDALGCGDCGETNRPGNRFCTTCGAEL